MSRRKPHNTDAGYIASRRHPTIKGVSGERGKGWVVIYEAAEQGLDTEGGRYAVVCNSHGNIVNESSLRGARASMKCPQNFCEECRNKEMRLITNLSRARLQALGERELQRYRANADKTCSQALGHTKGQMNEANRAYCDDELGVRGLEVDESVDGIFNGEGSW
jgi:hypothetical protein